MKGWAKNSGTPLTEDYDGCLLRHFSGSIAHAAGSALSPDAESLNSPAHRNVIVHPVWTQSDKGNHMLNYADLIGIPAWTKRRNSP